MKKNLAEEILEKFVQCEIPFTIESTEWCNPAQGKVEYLRSSSLKDYTESLLLRYIYEEEDKEKEQYRKMIL